MLQLHTQTTECNFRAQLETKFEDHLVTVIVHGELQRKQLLKAESAFRKCQRSL